MFKLACNFCKYEMAFDHFFLMSNERIGCLNCNKSQEIDASKIKSEKETEWENRAYDDNKVNEDANQKFIEEGNPQLNAEEVESKERFKGAILRLNGIDMESIYNIDVADDLSNTLIVDKNLKDEQSKSRLHREARRIDQKFIVGYGFVESAFCTRPTILNPIQSIIDPIFMEPSDHYRRGKVLTDEMISLEYLIAGMFEFDNDNIPKSISKNKV